MRIGAGDSNTDGAVVTAKDGRAAVATAVAPLTLEAGRAAGDGKDDDIVGAADTRVYMGMVAEAEEVEEEDEEEPIATAVVRESSSP